MPDNYGNHADTHSEYLILIAFPRQQWLRERASMLRLYVPYLSCCLLLVFPTVKLWPFSTSPKCLSTAKIITPLSLPKVLWTDWLEYWREYKQAYGWRDKWRLSNHEISFCVSHITAETLSLQHLRIYRARYFDVKVQFWALFTHVCTTEIMLVLGHMLCVPSA